MAKLKWYGHDGANYQAKAVLAYLQAYDGIEESWNDKYHCYDANIDVNRWENGREQGYVVSLRSRMTSPKSRQLNIAFFEHRNSDSICAIKWEQLSFNGIYTYEGAKFGDQVYVGGKYDVSHKLSHGEAEAMADWIWKELVDFWVKTDKFGE